MVPHRKILRAISLVSYCAINSVPTRDTLLSKHKVRYPGNPAEFWTAEVMYWLAPELQALFLTTDSSLTGDYRPILMAARDLGIAEYIVITANGPDVHVSDTVLKWRGNDSMRIALESLILCGVETAQIIEDVRRLNGFPIDEADVRRFGELYVDREFALADNWVKYTECIGAGEASEKAHLMRQHRDYARWKIGVPVSLDSSVILDRLESDSYFTLMSIKAENDNALSRDQLARVKEERATIFKCVDRRVKMKEAASNAGGADSNSAAKAIEAIALNYTDELPPMMNDLVDGDNSSTSKDLQ